MQFLKLKQLLQQLELKFPPPIVMAVSGLIATIASQRGFNFIQQQAADVSNLIWPLVFIISGIGVALLGVKEFNQHQTTVNPIQPTKTTSLVTSGVYQLTRNPMYLGMLLVLLGWADLLDNFLAYSGALSFFLYISAFQIKPEEEVMTGKFSQEFSQYCSQVRRWL